MINNLFKYKFISLLLLFVIVGLAATKAPSIHVNTDISQFFHEDDADFRYYKKLKSEITNDENLILFAIKNKDSVFQIEFIDTVNALQNRIKKTNNIKGVNSLLNLSYPIKSMFGIIGVPYLKYSKQNLSFDKKKILNDELARTFINKEVNTLFLWIELETNLNSKEINDVVNDLNLLRNEIETNKTYLWGRHVIDVSFKNNLINEIIKFSFWIFIFLCLSLLFIFKNPLALVYPILLIVLVSVLFLGGMVYIDKPISTLSNLFPTIILIVVVSDVLHLCIKYDKEWQKGIGASKATKNTLKEIGWTTLITSLTTAVGFLVLYLSPMKAMRNFGMESAFLVVLTYVLTIFLIPYTFYILKTKNLFTVRKVFDKFSDKIFKLQTHLFKYQNKVIISFSAVLLLCCFGIMGINTNSSHYSIPKKTDLYHSFKFFEQNFGGSRTFELVLESTTKQTLNSPELLENTFKIHDYLKAQPKLNFIKSPVNYYRTVHKAYYPGSSNKRAMKFDINTIKKYDKEIKNLVKNDYLANKNRTLFKFTAQMRDYGKREINALKSELLRNVDSIIGDKAINARLSGIDLLIDISQRKSINNTFYGLLIAIFVVSITLGLVFKNTMLALIAVILNILPLIMTAGVMGFTNMELRAETALIFTVGFVIAVDDTIHLLSKFQWERKKGRSIENAILIAAKDCGKAIIATSIVLLGGFFILMSSDQTEIRTLGFLVGIIVLITLYIDLIIAPIIITKWFRKYL